MPSRCCRSARSWRQSRSPPQAVAACSAADLRSMVAKSVGPACCAQPNGNESILALKHAPVQDAAYTSLLNSEKRRLHAAALAHRAAGRVVDRKGAPCRRPTPNAAGLGLAAQYLIGSLSQAIAVGQSRGIARARTLNVVGGAPMPSNFAIDAVCTRLQPLLALGESSPGRRHDRPVAGPPRDKPAGGGDEPASTMLAGRLVRGGAASATKRSACQRTG